MLFCISFYLGKSKVVFLPEGLIGYVKPESKVSCLKTIWGTAWGGLCVGDKKKLSGLPNKTSIMDCATQQNIKDLIQCSDSLLKQPAVMRNGYGEKVALQQTNDNRLSWFADQLIIQKQLREEGPKNPSSSNHSLSPYAKEGLGPTARLVSPLFVHLFEHHRELANITNMSRSVRFWLWSYKKTLDLMQSSTSNIPVLNPEADKSSEVILALPIRPSGREYGTNLQSFIWSYILKNVHHVLLWTVNQFFWGNFMEHFLFELLLVCNCHTGQTHNNVMSRLVF